MLSVSCNKDGIRGSGTTRTEFRNAEPFTRVHTNRNIVVHVSYGSTQKVTVSGYDNLLDITETKVSEDVLKCPQQQR